MDHYSISDDSQPMYCIVTWNLQHREHPWTGTMKYEMQLQIPEPSFSKKSNTTEKMMATENSQEADWNSIIAWNSFNVQAMSTEVMCHYHGTGIHLLDEVLFRQKKRSHHRYQSSKCFAIFPNQNIPLQKFVLVLMSHTTKSSSFFWQSCELSQFYFSLVDEWWNANKLSNGNINRAHLSVYILMMSAICIDIRRIIMLNRLSCLH